MKRFLLISLFLSVITAASAQSCLSVQTGNFKISDKETGVTIIARNEKYQIEENVELNFKMMFSVTWIDDCTYELRPIKVIHGDSSYLKIDAVITTQIIKVKSHGYQAVVTTNFSSYNKTFIVEMIE